MACFVRGFLEGARLESNAVAGCDRSQPPQGLHIYDQFVSSGMYGSSTRIYSALSRVSMLLPLIILAHVVVGSVLPLGLANGNAVATL